MNNKLSDVKVIKRDNTIVPFTDQRIFNAINCAAERSNEQVDVRVQTDLVCNTILNKIYAGELSLELPVETIQDLVVDRLLHSQWKKTAEEYISYRRERDIAREQKTSLIRSLEGFLHGDDPTYKRENANKDSDELSSHRDLIAGIVSKQLAKNILPANVLESNEKGEIHTHDLDYLLSTGITNCGVYNFQDMLANGVTLGDVDIETPKNVQTAANVMCQILCKISGVTYGGQSIHEFDKVLRPYALKTEAKLREEQEEYNLPESWFEKKLRKAIYDACQTFLYQSSTCTSPNGQSSFCAISLSLSTDQMCKMIKEEYLKCHMNGIGAKHKTPIFPKVLYFTESGVNLQKNDPNYDELQLAMECSTKRMYPDYILAKNNRIMTGGNKVITCMGKL